MKQTIVLLNDTTREVVLRVIDGDYDHAQPDKQYRGSLRPQETRAIEVEVPEGHVLYIKDWDGAKLVSTLDLGVLKMIKERPR